MGEIHPVAVVISIIITLIAIVKMKWDFQYVGDMWGRIFLLVCLLVALVLSISLLMEKI